MENQEIKEIKKRINNLISNDKTASSVKEDSNNYAFEDSVQLTKEQYLEIELGLEQIKRGEVYNAREVLKSLRNW